MVNNLNRHQQFDFNYEIMTQILLRVDFKKIVFINRKLISHTSHSIQKLMSRPHFNYFSNLQDSQAKSTCLILVCI